MISHFAAALIALAVNAAMPPALAATGERIALPAGFAYPNGIARGADDTLYVGSVTSGSVLRLRPGTPHWEALFSGSSSIFAGTSLRLDEPRGLIWGASPDFLGTPRADGSTERRPHRIYALDARTGAPRRVLLMPEGGFGNDIAVDRSGGLFVTDSVRPRVLRLAPAAEQLETFVEDDRFRPDPAGAPGLAGIALAPDGATLAVNHYGSGRLFLVRALADHRPLVAEVLLERRLENPDGMQFAPDGKLLVVEGAVRSGDGRLLRINVLAPSSGRPLPVEMLASGLQSPVNLTLGKAGWIWLTESRIRHRLVTGAEPLPVPDAYWVTRLRLPPGPSPG